MASTGNATKWNDVGARHPKESIVSVALGVENEGTGHVSLIFGFSDGSYEEVNFGRYGKVTRLSGHPTAVGKGGDAFNYDYQPGTDDKTVYF